MGRLTRSEHPYYRKAKRRLRAVPTDDIIAWMDTSVWALQRGVEGYRAERAVAALEEVESGIYGLLAAHDVLLDREDS